MKKSLSLNKSAPLHSLVDDQLIFYNNTNPISESLSKSSGAEEQPSISKLSPLSHMRCSCYSTWKSLNAIIEQNNVVHVKLRGTSK